MWPVMRTERVPAAPECFIRTLPVVYRLTGRSKQAEIPPSNGTARQSLPISTDGKYFKVSRSGILTVWLFTVSKYHTWKEIYTA